MKQCVSGQCWMNVWLSDGEPGSSFKSRALHSRSRLLVLEWLCTKVWLWCCMWTHASLICLQGADNLVKSSEWDHKCYCTLDMKTKTSSAADIGVLCSLCFLFPFLPVPTPPFFFFFYVFFFFFFFVGVFCFVFSFYLLYLDVSFCISVLW